MKQGHNFLSQVRWVHLVAAALLVALALCAIPAFRGFRATPHVADKHTEPNKPATVTDTSADVVSYRVGPGQRYKKVSEVAGRLQPGDIVEVTGDISDSFELIRNGTREYPILIRGAVRNEGNRIVRPKVMMEPGRRHGIVCRGDWNALEGLAIMGATSADWDEGTAIRQECDNLVIRNCRISGNKQGIYSTDDCGSTVVEFCEFDSDGGVSPQGSQMHSVYVCPRRPGSCVTVRHCFFRDATGGTFVKSRAPRNVIAYNWFENHFIAALYLVDSSHPKDEKPAALYPMHSDIVGNVFLAATSPKTLRWKVLHLGSESEDAAGTEGDFNIAHNLFLIANAEEEPSAPILVHGNVDHVRVFNNVFVPMGVTRFRPYERSGVWDTPRTREFVRRRGTADPIVEGSNNWISERATDVPDVFRYTLRGRSPAFVDGFGFDFRPRVDSPLARAGMWPLPKGQIIDLAPEYEPQRGIPTDLKPKPRRKVTPPSIGPFEVER